VKTVVNDALGDFFDKTPSVARTIIAKAVSARGRAEAARKARELVRKRAGSRGGCSLGSSRLFVSDPKLTSCTSSRAIPRRLGQARAGPQLSGDPAAARQDFSTLQKAGSTRSSPTKNPDDHHGDPARASARIQSRQAR